MADVASNFNNDDTTDGGFDLAMYGITTDSAGGALIARGSYCRLDVGTSTTIVPVSTTNPLPISDAGGTITVDGTVAVSGTVTIDSELPAAAALADNASNPTAPAVGAFGMLWDGATWDRQPGTSADGALVNLGANNDVTVTGTVTANAGTGPFPVSDNAGSLTVDAPVGTPVFVRLSDGSAAITALPITDNSGSITVDGTVAVSGTVTISGAVTNAGTFVVQENGAALTALQLLDDTVYAEDVAAQAADKGVAILAVRRDADTTLVGTDNDYANLQVDANGYLKVEIFDGGGSHTVDGTVSVSGTVTVDGSGVTQPISHAALTELAAAIDTEVQCDIVGALPAGTNAIGKLAANSGVDIGDVDVTSLPSTVHSADFDTGGGTDTTLAFGIAVPASGGAAVVPGDATAGLKVDLGADNDVTVTGSVTANAGTNLNTSALALESGGNLAGAATSLAVLDDWDESDRAKVNIIVGQAGIAAGAGAVGATVPRVTLASDDPGVALLTTIDADTGNIVTAVQLLDDPVFADDAAFTIGTSKVMMAGATVDEASTDSADEGDAVALRATADRKLIVTTKPTAAGEGCDVFRSIDLDETEEDVKTSAGMLYGYYFSNEHATSRRFLRFYNATAANTTVGSTAPLLTLALPAASAGHISFTHPIKFDTALCVAATTAVGDSDTGAPGANEVTVNVFYK